MNEQDYSSDGVHFEYQQPVRVRSVEPSRGPVEGGTFVNVTGSGFARRAALLGYLFCRFNHTLVAAVWRSSTELHCIAPEHVMGVVNVELTLNDQQYTSSGVHFEYQDVALHSIEPPSGPVLGGTSVTVRGSNVHTPGTRGLFCQFVGMDVVAASYEGEASGFEAPFCTSAVTFHSVPAMGSINGSVLLGALRAGEYSLTVSFGGGYSASTDFVVEETSSADAVPEFSLPDENPLSASYGESISPSDYLGQVTGWYFIKAT